MVQIIKNLFGKLLNQKSQVIELPVLKTRTQLIEEGRGAYLPKRARHGSPLNIHR